MESDFKGCRRRASCNRRSENFVVRVYNFKGNCIHEFLTLYSSIAVCEYFSELGAYTVVRENLTKQLN